MRTEFKAILLLFSTAVLLAAGAPLTSTQSAGGGNDSNAAAAVRAIVSPSAGCIPDAGGCSNSAQCCSAICSGGICGISPDPPGSVFDGFNPNANGTIRAVAVQTNGKILIGGDFTTLTPDGVNPITRNHIARLNPDGTVDPDFDPNANGVVDAIVVQTDGKILVGGQFNGANSIGAQPRNRIARLDAISGAADSFDPNANVDVLAIAVQADGKILAGGEFFSISGQPRNSIARLDATTGAADSWNPNANNTVRTIVVQADGKILVGGDFSFATATIGGQSRNFIARLDPTTGLADSFNPNANSTVRTIAIQADAGVLAGGTFTNIGGQGRNFIARLEVTTGLATNSFTPNANGIVESIVVQPDGKILVGGRFFGANSIGGQTRNRVARVDATTGQADSFDPNANNFVLAIAVQGDGKVLAGGLFSGANSMGGQTRNNIARMETDGRLDQTFNDLNLNAGGSVGAIALQPDGKILIGGGFTSILGVPRHNIARLNTDGTLDASFDPNANGPVNAIAVQTDSEIVLGGSFTTLQPNNAPTATTLNHIARLFSDATLDTSFNPNANDNVNAIAVQGDGKVLLGGKFTTLQPNNAPSATTRMHIARVFSNGALDTSFNPTANADVASIALQTDGKIVVGGLFNQSISTPTIGGATRNRIARLEPVFGTADTFDPNANGDVYAILVQPDGKILVGGHFNGSISTPTIGGATRNRIARLDSSGGADSLDANANGDVNAIALQADGKILAGGGFFGANSIGGQTRTYIARLNGSNGVADSFDPTLNFSMRGIAVEADGKILLGGFFDSIDGQARHYFARLSNDTAALQNLAATQSTVTWTRGGASPQFTPVTFESSTDNVNYTFLGNGTASGSNWTLTGLNLATGQNIYIRARGYSRSAYQNGSGSITESVRNAFIAPPPPTSVISLKTHGSSGPFPINLPLSGSPGIECRKGQGANADQHQVVFTFNVPITLSGSPTVSVSAPGGGTPGATASVSGSVVTVNLTGILNAQTLTITLTDVNDSGPLSVQMGVLLGDVNGDGFVLSGDYTAVRQKSGATVDGTNFQYDINVDGFILSGDYTTARQLSGSHLSPNIGAQGY